MSGIVASKHVRISEDELRWSFAHSSGPGGQNVNKVNSKATLRWTPREGQLAPAVWSRFKSLAKRYLTQDGEVVIQSQEHRDRPQNMDACRHKLRMLLQAALVAPKRRVKTKPTRSSQRRRLEDKRRQSDKKRSRQSRDFS